MTNPSDQPLKAAVFSPREELPAGATAPGEKRPSWLLPGIAVLALAGALVFFALPAWIDSDTTTTAQGVGSTQTGNQMTDNVAAGAASDSNTERSPFAEAQQQKLRKAAQDALQGVLEAQEELQAFGVETWAPDAYLAAVAVAETGDEAYRERQFTEAATAYQQAAAALAELQDSIAGRSDTARRETRSAVEAGNSKRAQEQRSLLAILAPGDPELPLLEERITAIPKVRSALDSADTAAQSGDTGAAVAAAAEAQAADPRHMGASDALARYREADIEARFRRAMSEGYGALEAEQFSRAASAFQSAAKIRAGAPEPRAALVELAAAETAWELRQLARQGVAQEQEEAWTEAVTTYETALEIDNTLIFAREGLARARPRADLAEAIKAVLDEPDRLVDARALGAAETLWADGQTLSPRGPLLEQQLSELAALLNRAKTPVAVTLTSDALTDVTLLRVKRLGAFDATNLTLRPGSYTALGVRNGFRDVRVNFDIKPDSQPVIDVRCQEAI